jgi:uncharacterized protein (TIGR02246 family)
MGLLVRLLLLFIIFTTPLVWAGQQGSGPGTAPQDANESGVRALVTASADAWNRHDAHAFAAIFSEDADFTNVIGMSAHGRKAIEEFHAPIFATRFKDTHLTATDTKIRMLSPTIASVDVHWEMTGALDSDGSPIPIRKGLLNWVVTQQNGHWLITVMHNQEFTPKKNP